MSRGLASNITTELAKGGFSLATLIQLNVGSSTIYMTDFGVALTDTDTQQYPDGANLIEIDNVTESGALKVNTFSLKLTGANQAFISLFLSNDYIDKQVLIKRALVNSSNSVINSFLFFDGRIVSYQIDDSEIDSSITIDIASHWADFEKINNRRTNLNSQQVHFPDDLGFEYASKITKDLRWGRKG